MGWIRAPDSAPIKQKMLYASSKQALKNKLVGLATELQASDRDELRFEEVRRLSIDATLCCYNIREFLNDGLHAVNEDFNAAFVGQVVDKINRV